MRAPAGRATARLRTTSDVKTEGPGMNRAFRVSLFLLLTLRVSLLAMLVCSLRVLFGSARMLLALSVVVLAVMFRGGTMCLGSVFERGRDILRGPCSPICCGKRRALVEKRINSPTG
jgi:hypothetical protein